MTVLESSVGNDDTSSLNVGGLEVLEQTKLVSDGRGNAVVTDQGLGEDQNLTTVRGISHRLGVADEGGGEDGLTTDVSLGAETLAVENRTILSCLVSH